MKTIYIDRNTKISNDKQSLGVCKIGNEDGSFNFPFFNTLERGWLNNASRVSCIPVGDYDLVYEYSDKFKTKLWEIKGAPGRSECKFHVANFWKDLEGCVSLGFYQMDINKDGLLDNLSSKAAVKMFHWILRNETKAKLIIRNV